MVLLLDVVFCFLIFRVDKMQNILQQWECYDWQPYFSTCCYTVLVILSLCFFDLPAANTRYTERLRIFTDFRFGRVTLNVTSYYSSGKRTRHIILFL